MSSTLFPMSDEPLGRRVLRGLERELRAVGDHAASAGVRIVNHPDQFVVLSSDKPAVVRNSIRILRKQALAMDLMGLPKNPWAALILHGGASGRADALVKVIRRLPENIRERLCLENDEYAYSAWEILDICRRAGVPMVFDNLHHVIRDKLDSYDHPSLLELTRAARQTWPDPKWQIVHLSNGRESFNDRHHSELIREAPRAFREVPWIEVEAKGKELAIADLKRRQTIGRTSTS